MIRNNPLSGIYTEPFERMRKFEYIIPLIYFLLLIIGVFAVRTATYGEYIEDNYYKQIIFSTLGIIVFFTAYFLKESFLKRIIGYLYSFTIFLLIYVLVFERARYGARRWIRVGPVGIQPSHLFLIFTLIIFAKYLAEKNKKAYYILSLTTLLGLGLIFKQPDLGMTLFTFGLWFMLTYVSGEHEKTWKTSMFLMLFSSPFAFYFMKDYQKARIIGFLFPEKNAAGVAYNTLQAMRAIGSGGFFGKGYLNGFMNLSDFVPEDHNDFIISVIGEEFGFLGITVIILLYGILIYRMYIYAQKTSRRFWKYIYFGTSLIIFFHVFENIGMNLGIMPVTGVPLPLISYGGSQIIIFSFLLGLVTKGIATTESYAEENYIDDETNFKGEMN
ncbi:bacterial cell division membrane protein [Marinitoga piezophila KA3]|uniref:Bacterial cell division membrane protein n=1 Tax=Marinitoga piezophila (strain DSM 14283 / JCM 11233 / KA3) TaxID=443254 RepID=H2J7Z5_MARPK|nr:MULTISPECIES: FtsW/RodA/SpoVE family cell cycle protein [Marinitoga]AEX85486.1 bacterial cell division membrane protein [Marinitoga piezophila KA3]